jgi:TonB family protein
MAFVKKEMVYPAEAKRKGVEGRVIVQFVVERDGRITSAKVIKSIDQLLDREALRIVRKMPRWNPGRQLGQTYRVKYVIPITFRLK